MRKICDPNIGVGKGHGISNTFNAKYKLATLDGRPLRSIIIDPSFEQCLIATIENPSTIPSCFKNFHRWGLNIGKLRSG